MYSELERIQAENATLKETLLDVNATNRTLLQEKVELEEKRNQV